MLRHAKIALICTVALWGFLGAFGNLMNWNGALGGVAAVTSMSTFEGGSNSWQATSQPIFIWAGALFIMVSKMASAVLCTVGGLKMWQAKTLSPDDFNQAKDMALTGCAIAVLMLFGGFIVIAEGWYELWRSDVMRGAALETAFRYAGMITLIAIFVASKDE